MYRDMRTKEELRRYLGYFSNGKMGPPCPVAKQLIKKGQWFVGRAYVAVYDITQGWAKRMRPQAGQCFYNAQRFCLANLDYSYFEGFYFIGGFPMPHGWVVGMDGRVIDFTLEVVLRNAKRNRTDYDDRPPLYRGLWVETHLIKKRFENAPRRPNPLRRPFLFAPPSN
jgi:hypothetical protein